MSELVKQLKERRAAVWEEAKAVVDRASESGRYLDAAESAAYEAANDDLDALDARIKTTLEGEARAKRTGEQFERMARGDRGESRSGSAANDALDERFRAVMRSRSPEPVQIDVPEHLRRWQAGGLEARALVTTGGPPGGWEETEFYQQILRHMVDQSGVLAAGANVISSAVGSTMMVPRSTGYSSAGLVTEASALPYSDPTLSAVQMKPHKFGFLTSLSNELANDNNFGLLGFLAMEAGVALGQAIGPYIVSGSAGGNNPRGFALDVTPMVTGASGVSGVPGVDQLIDLVHGLRDGYARSPSAGWLMNRATLRSIRKLKTVGSGEFFFSPDLSPNGLSAGTLLGQPVFTDPWVPSGAGAASIYFGAWDRLTVYQVGGIRFESDLGYYAFNQDVTYWRGVTRMDSALIDTNAVVGFQGGA